MSINNSILLLTVSLFLLSFTVELYPTNGETIYRTGKNIDGVVLLDKKQSRTTLFKSCQSCHGPKGSRMTRHSLKYSELSSLTNHKVPYTDSLIFRFLDDDLKSDGSPSRAGVKWNISHEDKKDLIEFLKTL